MTQRTFLTIILAALFLLAACSTDNSLTATDNLSYDNLVAQSDAVFLAQVSYISATQSSEPSAEPFHHIAFSIEQAIVDELGIGSGIVMTVFGESPVSEDKTATSTRSVQAVHQLQVGDSIVVFAKEGINGNQTVIVPATDAASAFLAADVWGQVQGVVSGEWQVANK